MYKDMFMTRTFVYDMDYITIAVYVCFSDVA